MADGMTRRPRRAWCLALLLVPVVCCGVLLVALVIHDRLLPPASEGVLRQQLTDKLAEAQTVWASLDDLWGRLEAGQTALCSEERVMHPYFVAWRSGDREAYPALAGLADRLNGAIRDLHRAADVWTAVCQGGEAESPQETAAEARAALDDSARGLAAVAEVLAGRVE
jgi:hypothetical protein